jgi:hypothetical protein
MSDQAVSPTTRKGCPVWSARNRPEPAGFRGKTVADTAADGPTKATAITRIGRNMGVNLRREAASSWVWGPGRLRAVVDSFATCDVEPREGQVAS